MTVRMLLMGGLVSQGTVTRCDWDKESLELIE